MSSASSVMTFILYDTEYSSPVNLHVNASRSTRNLARSHHVQSSFEILLAGMEANLIEFAPSPILNPQFITQAYPFFK